MKMQIREFARVTGVSVRTLHYYDQIGLLQPASVDKHSGYRFYDESSLMRMQQILFFRELDFSLKTIADLLASADYDTTKALQEQKKLLQLKKARLERLIAAIDDAQKGKNVMKAFDNTEFETYKTEAREKWGRTDAYKEHAEKTRGYTQDKWSGLAAGMDAIFGEFALCMNKGAAADSPEAQELVKKLQSFITANYYTCTREILSGLGQMYVADERFRQNIDRNAEGTAGFVSRAIAHYSKDF